MSLFPPLPSTPPPSHSYALFISHAWDYNSEFEGLVNLLNTDSSFLWDDLSVRRETPLSVLMQLPKSYRYLVRQLDQRISRADCLLVLAGMYVAHRGWIQSEIEAAQEFGKPIIAVQPRGNERFPEALMRVADESVRWNSTSIISAIRKHAGGPPKLLSPEIPQPNYRAPFMMPPRIPLPPPNSLMAAIAASMSPEPRKSIAEALVASIMQKPGL